VAAILLIAALVTLVFPASASALASTGHGVGYLWAGDGRSWLGTYRLADGRSAFCLEAGKSSPVGNDYDIGDSSNALGLSKSDIGRLAYIARHWAGAQDPTVAAAGQLAVWTITGLNGHTQSYYAGRANEHRAAVLTRMSSMLAEASANATVGATSTTTIRIDDDGTGSVRADLVSTLASGGAGYVAPNSVAGTITLTGAAFDDGSTSKAVGNAQILRIHATGAGATVSARASATFSRLGFGAVITVGSSGAGSQMLLFTPPSSGSASSAASTTVISPRPFQPRVSTQTSTASAAAGTRVSDRLHLDVAPGAGLLDEWGVYGKSADSTLPVPVTIRSSLLGPFPSAPKPSASWPTEPDVVCTVAVVATTGPGDYRTPECTLPSGGWFVWVETIDPKDTPADRGRDRVKPWKSPFASTTEVTHGTATPSVRTKVDEATGSGGSTGAAGSFSPGDCVVDELTASGFGPASAAPGVDVESILLGPFPDAIPDGRDFAGSDFDRLPVAGRSTTTVTGDGTYRAPCIPVDEPGHYVFVFRSDGGGGGTVPAFADLVAHTSEMLQVEAPTPPVPPTTPPVTPPATVPPTTPPATPHAPASTKPPHALAFTGATGVGPTTLAAIGAVSVGLAAVLATLVVRIAQRRRAVEASVRSSRSERP
jgi:hypothetical protein